MTRPHAAIVTAGDVAMALVGAARLRGISPAALLAPKPEDGRRGPDGPIQARRLAALALIEAFDLTTAMAARLSGAGAPQNLAPSKCASITADQIQQLAAELKPKATIPMARAKSAEASKPPCAAPVVMASPVPAPAPAVVSAPPEPAPRRLRRDGCAEPEACRAKGNGLCRRCFGKQLAARRTGSRAAKAPREGFVARTRVQRRARRDDAGSDGREVIVLKPLSPSRRRYCGWFLAAGWSPEEVAWLFSIDAAVLAS